MKHVSKSWVTIKIIALCFILAGICPDNYAETRDTGPAADPFIEAVPTAGTAPSTHATHPRPGETFRDCNDCPEMVVIPAGTFTMGAPKDEPGFYDEDGPQRIVSIRPFAAGKFDVTKGQWAAICRGHEAPNLGKLPMGAFSPKDKEAKASWRYLSFEQDDTHPVVCVTWNETQEYLAWISRRSGKHYRLMSEAEWEYAARAGTKTAYPWGSKATHEYANYGRDDEAGHGTRIGPG